jgi:hypothetical protein
MQSRKHLLRAIISPLETHNGHSVGISEARANWFRRYIWGIDLYGDGDWERFSTPPTSMRGSFDPSINLVDRVKISLSGLTNAGRRRQDWNGFRFPMHPCDIQLAYN